MSLSSDIPVCVEAPARLHLGFLDLDGTIGRRFGSIGLAIDQPQTRLTLRRLPDATPTGTPPSSHHVTGFEAKRAARALAEFTQRFDFHQPLHLTIEEAIPPHAGLGSGTQLAIAVGMATARLAGRSESPATLGETLARGQRSAIGMAAFENGGVIIDGGRGKLDRSAPIVSRLPFPANWRILLVLDRQSEGVHGEKETTAFANLPEMPEATAAHLCHLTLLKLLPAVAESDLSAFGTAVTEIQKTVGRHFAPHQGGDIWASERVGAFLRILADNGALGIGQSSWGPTGFAFVETPAEADTLRQRFAQTAKASGLELMIVTGRNEGASIHEIMLADSE